MLSDDRSERIVIVVAAVVATVIMALACYWRRSFLRHQRNALYKSELDHPMKVTIKGGVSVKLGSAIDELLSEASEAQTIDDSKRSLADLPGSPARTCAPMRGKYASSIAELCTGEPADAALGVMHFMRASPAETRAGMARGIPEIEAEFVQWHAAKLAGSDGRGGSRGCIGDNGTSLIPHDIETAGDEGDGVKLLRHTNDGNSANSSGDGGGGGSGGGSGDSSEGGSEGGIEDWGSEAAWWDTLELAAQALECLQYCLYAEAGSSRMVFANSQYPRDCDAKGVRKDRKTATGAGMRLADFVAMEAARTACLEEAEVLAVRFYTTAGFALLNGPLRQPRKGADGAELPHPFPTTVAHLSAAIGKLRAVGATSGDAHSHMDLWRGMSDLAVPDDFRKRGGTEVAPMSTTSTLRVALQYATAGTASLLFKLRTDTFMARGASIHFLSAFPDEDEFLFPPLTYLKPTGRQEEHCCGEKSVMVVEVVPHFGTAT